MASWSENSSYQGAASGAATGAALGGGYGAIVGGAVGFVAGGLMGGASEDAAREAEEERKKEIEKAIQRQNTADFNAKAQAEQWAMADIGINKDDQLQDARSETTGLKKDVANNNAAVLKNLGDRQYNARNGISEETWDVKRGQYSNTKANARYVKNVDNAIFSARASRSALAANEGIIASYENDMASGPKKY